MCDIVLVEVKDVFGVKTPTGANKSIEVFLTPHNSCDDLQ